MVGTVTLHIPGPKGLPITGNMLAFRKDPLGFLQKSAEGYGDIVRFRFGTRAVYLINDPEWIKDILVTKKDHFIKAKGLQVARSVVGDGILTSEGKKHIRQRRLMQPMFNREFIKTYNDIMVQSTIRLIDSWADGEVRTITDDMMQLTLSIISQTMFGIDLGAAQQRQGESKVVIGEAREIGRAMDIGMKYVTRKASSFINVPESIPLKANREFQKAKRTLDEVIYRIIEERRKHSGPHKKDLLGMLLAARDEDDGSGMDDEQVRDEVMTIFLAGHETTANTLSWTWYLLSLHSDAEEKFHHELDGKLAGTLPSVEALSRLEYLQQMIWESMRVFPAVWTINREVASEVDIGGHLFQPGDTLMMSQWVMHHNEKYYDNSNDFRPERFAGDFLKTIPAYAFFPFGGGPRMCIGNNFAIQEAALVLATIGQKWTLRLAANHPPVEPEPLITLRPKNGLRMQVSKRKV